jgi:hypothetical protein
MIDFQNFVEKTFIIFIYIECIFERESNGAMY